MKISYWSDYACPYCYIGKKRLEKAISELGLEKEIELEMLAFELDPNASYEVVSKTDERFAGKYAMSLDEARMQIENISLLGRQEGIEFNYANTQYTNTINAHRLTKFVKNKRNKEVNKVINLLFDAYFTKNLNLADQDVLFDIAKQVGVSKDEFDEFFSSDDYIKEVRLDEMKAYRLGVRGVPYFIIDEKYVISGAHSKDGMKKVISEAINSSNLNLSNGMACGINGCH